MLQNKNKNKKTDLVTGPVSILKLRNKANPYLAGSNKQHYAQTLGVLLIFTFITTYIDFHYFFNIRFQAGYIIFRIQNN